MENQIAAETMAEPGILVHISFVVFAISIAIAVVLQFKAKKHMKDDGFQHSFKDPLFRRKELVYDDRGMYFINLQKNTIIICTLTIVGLLAIDHFLL